MLSFLLLHVLYIRLFELLPINRAAGGLAKFILYEENGLKEATHGGADHWVSAAGRGRSASEGVCRQHGFNDASFYT